MEESSLCRVHDYRLDYKRNSFVAVAAVVEIELVGHSHTLVDTTRQSSH